MNTGEDFKMDMFSDPDNIEFVTDDITIQEEEKETPSDDKIKDNGEEIKKEEKEIISEEETPESVAKNEDGKEAEEEHNTSPNIYGSLANVLAEKGLLPSLKDKEATIKSVDDLVKIFKEEIKSNEFADLSDTQKEYLEAVREGIPEDIFFKHKEAENVLSGIDEEALENNQELREQVIFQDLVNSGLSEEKAKKLVSYSVKNGTDLEDSLEAIPSLLDYEKKQYKAIEEENKQKLLDREKEIQERNELLKKTILEKKELIKDIDLSEGIRKTAYENMMKIVGEDEQGRPENKLMQYKRENPEEFDAKLYLLFELTNGFTDLSAIKKSTSSNAVNELEETLRRSNFTEKGGQPDFMSNDDNYMNLGDELVL